jgi:uncharacterized protein DUF4276
MGEERHRGEAVTVNQVFVLVEGQTEETFVKRVLSPYLALRGVYLHATLVATRREKGIPTGRGGILAYGKVKTDITLHLRNPRLTMLTTMIDYYALPLSFPGQTSMPALTSCYDRVAYLEKKLGEDVGDPRFLPHLVLHEFEALLFVSPKQIADELPRTSPGMERRLSQVREEVASPEEINNRPQYAPSKRLKEISGDTYRKTLHGPIIAEKIGVDRIRSECAHFNAWLEQLESVAS